MPAGSTATAPPLTADDLLLLAKDPTSTLPHSLPDSVLLAAVLSLLSGTPDSLDLLPRLLALAATDDRQIRSIVDRILAADWPKQLLPKLAALLRDFPPSVDLSGLLEKIFRKMKEVDLQDLPSLAYQLLVLASKAAHRRTVVRGLIGFFAGPLRGPPAIVRQVEGTVLMHVNFAVKQDPALGQEVVASVRSDAAAVNHFSIGVLFSISSVRRFNESAIAALRAAVVGTRRDFNVSRDCKWLPECLKEECLETAGLIEKALTKAINESNCGREHVVPSVVQFGFVLLESAESEEADCGGGLMSINELGIWMLKTLFEVHDMARNEIIEQCKYRILSLKPQQISAVIKLLGDLVENYPYPMLEHVGRLKELLDYFIFMHNKTATSLVKAMLPLIKFSRDLQDYIILVTRKAMFRKEEAIRMAATSNVIDLILAERKLKKNNINSFHESSSQASCSQQAEITYKVEGLFQEFRGLLQRSLSQQAGVKEIVYQGFLKLVVLDPFISSSVFDFLWPHFLHFYHEESMPPLKIDNCFKLESGKVLSVEPLDCLLSCISWILLLQSNSKPDHPSDSSWPCFGFSLSQEHELQAGRSSCTELFSNALAKIRGTLKQCSFNDGTSQNPDCGSHSSGGDKIWYKRVILARVVEVFINIIALELEKTADEQKLVLEKELLELIDFQDSLEKVSAIYKQGALSRKRSSARVGVQDVPDKTNGLSKEYSRLSFPTLSQFRRPFFATSSIHQLLDTAVKLYNAAIDNNQVVSQMNSQTSSMKTLEQCLKLVSFTLKVCLHQIKSVISLGREPCRDPLQTIIYGEVKKLGRPIMQLLWLLKPRNKLESASKKKEPKEKKFGQAKGDQLNLLLMCLTELFKLKLSKDNLNELIRDLVSVAATEMDLQSKMDDVQGSCEQELAVDNPHVKCINSFLDKRIKPLYAAVLALSLFQETEVLSELFLTICQKLPNKERDSHGNWAANICRNTLIENPNAAKSVVALAINLMSAPGDLILAHDVALELLKVMGSEDTESIELSDIFPIINRSTRIAIASVLLQLVESSLIDLEWAISKQKVCTTSDHEIRNQKKSYPSGERPPCLLLEALYSRSEALVIILSCFAEMNLKDSLAEQVLKITAKFYKLLARMTKLCIAPKGCKQLLPGNKFQKLAEVTCTKLTSPLYNFVALIQRNQQENVRSKGIISKIKRENKCIPDLIFQIEDNEKYLIQLSKLTKVNLLRHAKRSTARDFKILETTKINNQENASRNGPTGANSAQSDTESENSCDHIREENEPEKDASAESTDEASADEGSEVEREEEMETVQRKKARLSKVVEDSAEET